MITAEKTTSGGSLFDGSAERAIGRAADDAERVVAREGERMVRLRLGTVLRRPTGRYMSRIRTVRRGGVSEVNDSGIIYGPWLEGTGSRNRTTRFKGYFTFRTVSQQLDRRAGRLAEPVIDRAARGL